MSQGNQDIKAGLTDMTQTYETPVPTERIQQNK